MGGLTELMEVHDSSGSRRVTWVSVFDVQVHIDRGKLVIEPLLDDPMPDYDCGI